VSPTAEAGDHPAAGGQTSRNQADRRQAAGRRTGRRAEDKKPEAEPLLKKPIYLQAGSFQNMAEADNQKARLALMGVEARIQQVMLQDKVWYRVRLGPYPRMEEVSILRGELARQGIDARVVKKD
jgi:cell division protein FtsN